MSGRHYSEAAEQAARWVGANRAEAGPVLYDSTPGEALLLRHPGDAERLAAMLDDPAVEMGAGLFVGAAGIGFALSELGADAGPAVRVLRETAVPHGDGVHWGGLTDVIEGAAGIALFLIERGGEEATDLAHAACRWLVTQAQPADPGLQWSMGEPLSEWPFMPNFSHGTAGVAYALATVGQTLGDDELVETALRGAEHLKAVARTDDGGFAVRQHIGSSLELYPYGWCHGPTGLASCFRRLELATGDCQWRDLVLRCAHTVRTSGIPEQREPGFWDNVARCCGSTGVAELFLDLHQAYGDDDTLEFSILLTDDLLDRATVDEDGMRWSNVEHRNDPPTLPPDPGLMQGTSGIALWLTRLGSYLDGSETRISWPWSPFV